MAGTIDASIQDRDLLIHWLVSRQTTLVHEDEDGDDEAAESDTDEGDLVGSTEHHAGFNGRCNKPADTCYAWWIGATLKVIIHFNYEQSLTLTDIGTS